VPESTETVTEQLATARQNVKQSLERTKKTEILLVGSVVAVIVGGSLLFIGILVVRAVLQ
jgi:membrane-anchored glycerophosphoryl diester phosphodiesterase (GDPDase)